MANLESRSLDQRASLTSHIGIGGEYPLDSAIVSVLPEGTKVISADTWRESAWSATAKLTTIAKHGEEASYFLKCIPGNLGKSMLDAEFTGLSELHWLTPSLVPGPLAWGKLQLNFPETYFLLIDFKDFTNSLPDPVRLGARVADMHKKSVSPTGMFGFQMVTYDGNKPQDVAWDSSWASLFTKLLRNAYLQDVETNGIWKELDEVFYRTTTHLIPRLLGILQAEGRTLKPCLIHGDMWEGNIGTEIETGDPWIYDCAVYYAHNEMELGIWTAERHQLKAKAYKREYLRNMEPSEPAEEWEDRNRLYRTKTNFAYSADFPGSEPRQQAFRDLKYLIQKYVPWQPNKEDDQSN